MEGEMGKCNVCNKELGFLKFGQDYKIGHEHMWCICDECRSYFDEAIKEMKGEPLAEIQKEMHKFHFEDYYAKDELAKKTLERLEKRKTIPEYIRRRLPEVANTILGRPIVIENLITKNDIERLGNDLQKIIKVPISIGILSGVQYPTRFELYSDRIVAYDKLNNSIQWEVASIGAIQYIASDWSTDMIGIFTFQDVARGINKKTILEKAMHIWVPNDIESNYAKSLTRELIAWRDYNFHHTYNACVFFDAIEIYDNYWNELCNNDLIRRNQIYWGESIISTKTLNIPLQEWVSNDDQNIYMSIKGPNWTKHFKDETKKEYFKIGKIKIAGQLIDANACAKYMELDCRTYPLSKIVYFRSRGSVETVQDVKTSGGDVNLAGAVAGEMLMGTAGAVLLGRNKVEINTETKTVDNRTLEILIENDSGKNELIKLPYIMYERLLELIPNKEYQNAPLSNAKNNYSNNDISSPVNTETNAEIKSSLEKMKELKTMLDLGLITQDEYAKKKKELLDKM
ncbi:MAG: SHOCT domain-containing protein [Prevotella sp.]|nr:SHOCT domain-containing protein [Prevotella sp.]